VTTQYLVSGLNSTGLSQVLDEIAAKLSRPFSVTGISNFLALKAKYLSKCTGPLRTPSTRQ